MIHHHHQYLHIRTGAANGPEETVWGGADPLDARLPLAPWHCPCPRPRLHPRCPWSASSFHSSSLHYLFNNEGESKLLLDDPQVSRSNLHGGWPTYQHSTVLMKDLWNFLVLVKAHRNVSVSEKITNYKKTPSNDCPIYPSELFPFPRNKKQHPRSGKLSQYHNQSIWYSPESQ